MPVPEVLAIRTVAKTRFFRIEEMDLRFASGEERTYERLPGGGRAAVIVVPVSDDGNVFLIREYAAGFHELQLSLVKGAAEGDESLEEAANRELKEEIGMGARRLQFIKKLNLAPGHMGFTINVLLARDLYTERLPGDEPEPPEIVPWPVAKLDELIISDEFNEARAIAALTLVRPFL
ncbi:MAG: ADP compounds hydrolase NudE [Gammaproteobacteria bacterium]|nr:ADP compounds hydrolase NudE [Gammaproteobacteria bacterium]